MVTTNSFDIYCVFNTLVDTALLVLACVTCSVTVCYLLNNSFTFISHKKEANKSKANKPNIANYIKSIQKKQDNHHEFTYQS